MLRRPLRYRRCGAAYSPTSSIFPCTITSNGSDIAEVSELRCRVNGTRHLHWPYQQVWPMPSCRVDQAICRTKFRRLGSSPTVDGLVQHTDERSTRRPPNPASGNTRELPNLGRYLNKQKKGRLQFGDALRDSITDDNKLYYLPSWRRLL